MARISLWKLWSISKTNNRSVDSLAARKPRRENEEQLRGAAEETGGESVRPSSSLKSCVLLIMNHDYLSFSSQSISLHSSRVHLLCGGFFDSFFFCCCGDVALFALCVMWSLCVSLWCGPVWISITSFLWSGLCSVVRMAMGREHGENQRGLCKGQQEVSERSAVSQRTSEWD